MSSNRRVVDFEQQDLMPRQQHSVPFAGEDYPFPDNSTADYDQEYRVPPRNRSLNSRGRSTGYYDDEEYQDRRYQSSRLLPGDFDERDRRLMTTRTAFARKDYDTRPMYRADAYHEQDRYPYYRQQRPVIARRSVGPPPGFEDLYRTFGDVDEDEEEASHVPASYQYQRSFRKGQNYRARRYHHG